jgi:hypothetical protein
MKQDTKPKLNIKESFGIQLVHFARTFYTCNNVSDFNDHNLVITEKLLHT